MHVPVPNKAVNDIPIVYINNEYSVELLTIVFAQLRSYLETIDMRSHVLYSITCVFKFIVLEIIIICTNNYVWLLESLILYNTSHTD